METPFISASSSQGISAGTSIVSLDATSPRAKVKPMIFSFADSYEEPASARETTIVPETAPSPTKSPRPIESHSLGSVGLGLDGTCDNNSVTDFKKRNTQEVFR